MKTCTKCGGEHTESNFHKDARNKDGLRNCCKQCSSATVKLWQIENPEKKRAKSRRWESNRNQDCKVRYSMRSSVTEKPVKKRTYNKEKARAWAALNHASNPKAAILRVTAWRAKNKAARSAHDQNRRARKRAVGGKLSKNIASKLYALQRGKCACCGIKLVVNHLDHIMPLALDGPNEDWNMQLLCPPCNMQKHAKHPIDFMQQRGFLI